MRKYGVSTQKWPNSLILFQRFAYTKRRVWRIKLVILKGNKPFLRLVFEVLSSIKRAGADIIISYHAPDVARWLGDGAGD